MGVTYLLDTHVLLWLLADPDRIDGRVRATLADRSHRLLVSAASALEIATKVRIGKLVFPGAERVLPARIADIGAEPLPIDLHHALLAGSLPWSHRDPFDRLLVAQAIAEQAVLVTVDRPVLEVVGVATLTW